MITIREYLDLRGRNIWEDWFEGLDVPTDDNIKTAPVKPRASEEAKAIEQKALTPSPFNYPQEG